MKKIVIHIGILMAVFLMAVGFFEYMFSRGNDDMMMDIGNATLPRLQFSIDGYGVNSMNGYVQEMDRASLHDSITPITKDQVIMDVEQNGYRISSLDYQVYTLDGEELLYENHLAEVGSEVRLTFKKEILSEERLLMVILHSNDRDLYYYTRIVDSSDLNLNSCLEYVYNYHENALAKRENTGVGAALETTGVSDTYAHLTIQSDYDHVTWGKLNPAVVGGERWKILETNAAYTSVLLEYEVSCDGEENDTDLYMVKEFFRVRYAGGVMYLLNYDRSMEQIFNPNKQVLDDKGILLGISDSDTDYAVSEKGTVVAFVQANELWSYNRDKGELALLFSFRDAENADLRNKISDHKIEILEVNEQGDTSFAVIGYMNRGIHEGQVGVGIYQYNIATNNIQENVFIPTTKSAAIAQKEMGKLIHYSSERACAYLMLDDKLYEVDTENHKEKVVVEGLQIGTYAISENNCWIAYEKNEGTQIAVMSLDSAEVHVVDSGDGEKVYPLGFIGDDFICGFGKDTDEGLTASGSPISPMYSVEIRSSENKVLKTYSSGDTFVSGAVVSGGMITLDRVVKKESVYVEAGKDYIANNKKKEDSGISLKKYVTELKGSQVKLVFSDGNKNQDPKVLKPKLVNKEKIQVVKLDTNPTENGYYVYGLGKLQGIYQDASTAITKADEVSGVVISSQGLYVWERGNRYLAYTITGEDKTLETIQKKLAANTKAMKVANLVSDQKGIDLTGCSVEQLLYLVNKDTYVMVVRPGESSLILTGYDSAMVTYIDMADMAVHSAEYAALEGKTFVGYLK